MTRHFPTGEEMSIYDASMRYQADGTPLVVLAGKEYGTGSSRDWAAKGTLLLGVQGGHRRELRAHPPQQSGRHGRAAAAVPAGRERGLPRTDRRGGVRHSRRRDGRPEATPHRSCHAAGRQRQRVRGDRPDRQSRSRSSTTATAASCRPCCAASSAPAPRRKRSPVAELQELPAYVDTVIVGGGSAGAVIAGLLAERSDASILLIEAGPDYGPVDSGRWPERFLDARSRVRQRLGVRQRRDVPRPHDSVRAGPGYRRLLRPQRVRRDLGQPARLRPLGRSRQSWLEHRRTLAPLRRKRIAACTCGPTAQMR